MNIVNRSRPNRILAWGVIGLAFLLTLGIVISLGGFLCALGLLCWDNPVVVPFFGALVVWIVYSVRKIRRTERAEIDRFQQRTQLENSEFLSDIGIDPTSPEAEIAVSARQAFADLGLIAADGTRQAVPDPGSSRAGPDVASSSTIRRGV